MSEFGDLVGKRKAETTAESTKASEQEARKQQAFAENEARLQRILYVAPILAGELLAREIPTDIEMRRVVWEMARKGLGKEPVPRVESSSMGWSATQSLRTREATFSSPRPTATGVMLTAEGVVKGYKSATTVEFSEGGSHASVIEVGVGALNTGKRYYSQLGRSGAEYALDEGLDTETWVPYFVPLTYKLTDVEANLADLVVEHSIDPDVFRNNPE